MITASRKVRHVVARASFAASGPHLTTPCAARGSGGRPGLTDLEAAGYETTSARRLAIRSG
jgi:hypothetical protein